MRRTGWTVATACAAAVAIGGAQLVGTNGHGNGSGQDASSFASAKVERRACTVRTLRGSYVFSATGFNIVGGVQQPKAIVEVIAFNGDGTLDVPAATVSLNGVIIRSLPSVWNLYGGGRLLRNDHAQWANVRHVPVKGRG